MAKKAIVSIDAPLRFMDWDDPPTKLHIVDGREIRQVDQPSDGCIEGTHWAEERAGWRHAIFGAYVPSMTEAEAELELLEYAGFLDERLNDRIRTKGPLK